MRIRVYFVRHAEAQTNTDPFYAGAVNGLTETGIAQAKAIALRCTKIPLEHIYTSPVLRAQLTAVEIGKALGKEPISLDLLKERKGTHSLLAGYRNDEPFESLKTRLTETKIFLEHLPHKHVVIVSHAIFLRAFAGHILFGDAFTEELLSRMNETFTIGHTSLSKFEFNTEKAKWRMGSCNDETHLSVL